MAEPKALHVLLAPFGQLTGNGQLRESINERRERRGNDYPMWYLPPQVVKKLNLSDPDHENYEAVIAEDQSAIDWLKLRFGGESKDASLDTEILWKEAGSLPEADERRDISIKNNG